MPYPPASSYDQTVPETALELQVNAIPGGVGNAHTIMGTTNEDGEIMPPYNLSSEAASVLDRMSNLTSAETTAIAAFVDGQVAANNWDLIDEFFAWGLSDPADALTGFKTHTATNSGMTHVPMSGYLASASSNLLDTTVIPANLTQYQGGNAFHGTYLTTYEIQTLANHYLHGADAPVDGPTIGMQYSSQIARYASRTQRHLPQVFQPLDIGANIFGTRSAVSPFPNSLYIDGVLAGAPNNSANTVDLATVSIYINGHQDVSNNQVAGQAGGTYSYFIIGGFDGLDVLALSNGLSQFLYDIGVRTTLHFDNTTSATGEFGSQTHPFSAVGTSIAANLTGNQYGNTLAFAEGTVYEESLLWTNPIDVHIDSYVGAGGAGADPIFDGAGDVTVTWTPVASATEPNVYFDAAQVIDAEIGIILGGNNCHRRASFADIDDSVFHGYSDGFTRFFGPGPEAGGADRLYIHTDSATPPAATRMGIRPDVVLWFTSVNCSMRNVLLRHGTIGNFGGRTGCEGLVLEDMVTIECGNDASVAGFNGINLKGNPGVITSNAVIRRVISTGHFNQNGNGIELGYLNNPLVEDCDFSNNNNSGIELWQTTTNGTYRRNIIGNVNKAFWYANEQLGIRQDHIGNRSYNNIVRQQFNYRRPEGTSGNPGGIPFDHDSGDDNWFFNNTVVLEDGFVMGMGGGSGINTLNTGVRFFNNIIYMVRSLVQSQLMFVGQGDVTYSDVEFANNTYFNANSGNLRWFTDLEGITTGLATFQAQEGNELGSVEGDPLLTNINPFVFDYTISVADGGAALNAGNASRQPADDYILTPRVRNDAGAYEAT